MQYQQPCALCLTKLRSQISNIGRSELQPKASISAHTSLLECIDGINRANAGAADGDAGAASAVDDARVTSAEADETRPTQPRCDSYLQDLRSQLWATLEQRNNLPIPVAEMSSEARAALVSDLLTKLHDV